MSEQQASAPPRAPQIKSISFAEIGASLRAGWRDFLKAPAYGLFFGAIFAAGGLFIVWVLSQTDQLWMVIPVMIGFPLIGPFIATGLYEISRRLQKGEPLSWRAVLVTVFNQRERQMGWMAFVVLFDFWVWIYLVRILLALFMGFNTPSTLEGFLNVVLSTSEGLTFLAVGTLVGAVLALFLFSITVVAMPLLLDTELDFVTAMITSVRSVTRNPAPMLFWGLVVTILSVLAMVPAFLGLLVILPVLGHATWHLYQAITIKQG
ncbi:MAG: DUF2189 domain-containing protein [Hyphomicrobiaceae bacterium]|nr:DUF2189 domain-containing protein [Hyphomicrobiaceae bacterium]